MTDSSGTTEPDTILELRLATSHTVLVLVSVVDRRLGPAVGLVSRLGYADTRALHVSVDPDETRRLAADWMTLGLSWLPLHIQDATTPSLLTSVRNAVEAEAGRTGSLTVVLPELDWPRRWYSLLHRHSARRIVAELQTLPGVTAVVVPFSPGGRRRRRAR